MQPFKYLTDSIAVAGQLQPEDLLRAREAGFKTILNNRPDAEELAQPEHSAMGKAAQEQGLDYHFLPVVAGNLTDDNVAEFKRLLPQLEQPVLMFCRTGTRCTHLWALASAAEADKQWIIQQAAQAGYDISGLAPRIEAFS